MSPGAVKMERVVVPSSRNLPAGLSVEEWSEAVRGAAALWSYPAVECSTLELRVESPQWLRTAEQDGQNIVVFRTERWCHNERCADGQAFPPLAVGMTTTYPLGSRGVDVKEADIELNTAHFGFRTATSSGPTRVLTFRFVPLWSTS